MEGLMKKIYIFVLLCVPLCLILGFGTLKATGGSGQEEQQMTGYGIQKERIDVMEVGKLLERLGKEIQQNQSINVGGKTYPVKGMGGLEFSVRSRRPGQVGVSIDFGVRGEDAPQGRGNSYVAYSGGIPRGAKTPEFAAKLAEITEALASTGSFVFPDHKVALKGNIGIQQKMWENIKRGGNNPQYNYVFDVYFGDLTNPGRLVPRDEENDVTEYEEAVKMGWIKEHAICSKH
jgi:hypothetical protein